MWRSPTGYISAGAWISADLAYGWLDYLKKNYPYHNHWLETQQV